MQSNEAAEARISPNFSEQHDPFEAEALMPRSSIEQLDAGRRARQRLPRAAIAKLTISNRDPLGIIEEQNRSRLQDLVSLRIERMSASPFAFYRGTAAIVAADLAADPHTGMLLPSCGDAHLSNFGFYASPQRTLIFDLNDFDEAAWAPWEWDLKRLITSLVVAGQATARDDAIVARAVLSSTRAYAISLRSSISRPPIARFFTHLDAAAGMDSLDRSSRKVLRKAIAHASKRTGERAARKLTVTDETGRLRFVEQPPIMSKAGSETERYAREYMRRYLESATSDVQQLMQHYILVDVARRVVGVGSVGTRCNLALLQDGDGNALIMQTKEAKRSVIEQYGGIAQPRILHEHVGRHGEGVRVVAMQRILQAVSDPFLGYLRSDAADLYVRQFHDMKGGIDAETLDDEAFVSYAQACAVVLARAHSQSPNAATVSGYVGSGRALGRALLEWGHAYAELSRRDFEEFVRTQGTHA